MAILAEHFVLCAEQALDGTHQRAAFACQVGNRLTLESGFEEVARADADADGQGILEGMA